MSKIKKAKEGDFIKIKHGYGYLKSGKIIGAHTCYCGNTGNGWGGFWGDVWERYFDVKFEDGNVEKVMWWHVKSIEFADGKGQENKDLKKVGTVFNLKN